MTKKSLVPLLLVVLVAGVFASSASAAKQAPTAPSTCTITPDPTVFDPDQVLVTATGLPNDVIVTFVVTRSTGTFAFDLGYATGGVLSAPGSLRIVPVTFQFVELSGPHDRIKTVFSECSAG